MTGRSSVSNPVVMWPVKVLNIKQKRFVIDNVFNATVCIIFNKTFKPEDNSQQKGMENKKERKKKK